MKPWFKIVSPHADIKQGILDESVFAANLAEVVSGKGREVYTNPAVFFSKTYFTLGLRTVIKRVVQGLNGAADAENRVISLQTGFGGGKTHALISLYHIANWGDKANKSEATKDLIAHIGQMKFEKASIAVFTNATNDPTQGRKVGKLHLRTLWGELAYQLGGEKAYEIIAANDENRTAPKGLFKKVLALTAPALILIDELADYCVSASGVTVGASTLADQTISFVQELSEAISGQNNCVLVATLPASVQEVATSPQAQSILTSLSNRLSRVGADTKPINDEEIFEVVRRRLFEDLGSQSEIEDTVSTYMLMYQHLWTELPQYAGKMEYKTLMLKAYPFHPELIEMFRVRWASSHDFQRTRGVLRLLASIVSDLWKRQSSLAGNNSLIHTSDVNFSNLDALSSQLKKLYGNGYDAVIAADVAGTSSNAFKIDSETKEYGMYHIAQGVAATILLGSFGSSGVNKGVSAEELKLCVLRPDTFNHNSVNGALDKLEDSAHYLYYSTTGHKRYWFHTKPNINILIGQAKSEIVDSKIESEVVQRIASKVLNVSLFNVLVNPTDDVPEQTKPTLVILKPSFVIDGGDVPAKVRQVIEALATKKGNTNRVYRNTMLYLLCSEMAYGKLQADTKEYLACLRIRDEYISQLEKEQKEEIKRKIDEYSEAVNKSIATAYSVVMKYSAKNGFDKIRIKQFKDSIDVQINANIINALKDEEWLLDAVGMNVLKTNKLLPTPDSPIRVKDIYDAFIQFDDKPMITGVDAIQRSLQRYCTNGEYAVGVGDGKEFKQVFYKEEIPFFEVKEPSYWLVDRSLYTPIQKPSSTSSPSESSSPSPSPSSSSLLSPSSPPQGTASQAGKVLKSITVSGSVGIENYGQVFTSFINPLIKNGVEIKILIKGKSTAANPITENSQQYKITKESAKQLGLKFEEE
jgi:Protein of unknown function (DUF499)